MRRAFAPGVGLALVALVGCGGPKIVPVSGVVKVNGEPYPNAVVTFQPVAKKGDNVGARGSSAKTDADGRFTLIYDGTTPGALVGKHVVRISTDLGHGVPDTEGDPEALAKGKKINIRRLLEPIPLEWHDQSTKTFVVPPGGTSEANFDIDSPMLRKAKDKKKK